MEKLREVVAPEKFEPTEKKVNAFKAGHATVMFFDDSTTTEGLQKRFPLHLSQLHHVNFRLFYFRV